MDASTPLVSGYESRSGKQVSKKRKMDEKTVVRVRIEAKKGDKEQNNGGLHLPPDSWSWRKYGQKLLTGSPYPRGYYRCSTAKGCPAKKQVDRSKEDASELIIRYTSNHNHPGPQPKKKAQPNAHTIKAHTEATSPEKPGNKGNAENSLCDQGHQSPYHYMQSPRRSPIEGQLMKNVADSEPYVVSLDTITPPYSLDNSPMVNNKQHRSRLTEASCDFYDALDDLGFSTPASFTSLFRNDSNDNDESILGFPFLAQNP